MRQGDYQTDEQAREYHSNRFSGGLGFVHRQEIGIISSWLDKIKVSKNWRIIDLGSGTGRMIAQILAYEPKQIFAVDSSQAMLRQLSENFQKEILKNKITPVHSLANNLPFKKASTDLVISMHLFKHIGDFEQTITSIASVLSKQGYFMFDVLNTQSIIRFNLQGCYAYSLPEVKKILLKNSLRIKEVIYLQSFGETPYKIAGGYLSKILYLLDSIATRLNINLGTKMLILAEKQS